MVVYRSLGRSADARGVTRYQGGAAGETGCSYVSKFVRSTRQMRESVICPIYIYMEARFLVKTAISVTSREVSLACAPYLGDVGCNCMIT